MVKDIVEDSNSKEDDVSTTKNLFNVQTINYGYVPNPSHNPDFMEMDGKYYQNILISLIFMYGKEPEEINNNNTYNGCHPLIGDSALIRFKGPLEVYAVPRELNREL